MSLMCEKLEVLKLEEEHAIAQYERAQEMLDGAVANPSIKGQEASRQAILAKIEAASKKRIAAHEKLVKHRIEHRCS